jgi:hypothetical protein
MDLREKIERALARRIQIDELYLEDEDGISGYIVSSQFRGVDFLDRQEQIDIALRDPADGLSREEYRQVLAIAALTPEEKIAHAAHDSTW